MCRVLVVEDHLDTREAIAELLASEGHQYGIASNGQQALEWLGAQTELPCLILLDLRMPVMDGWDFLRAVRNVPKWEEIAFVVVSATVERDAPKPVLPAKAFWCKPLGPEQISDLHRHCDRHRDSWIPRAAAHEAVNKA
jgi:CheY-like chemotaxis protein